MAMTLNLKLRSEYKEEPIKSPRHMTPQCNRKITHRAAEASELKSFIRAYRKQVELPINFQTSIFQSKTPQRCLQHNNVITLYCINDKRPLCAHCMYQIIAHGKHEVVPLAKANAELREQLSSTIKDINTRLLPSMGQMILKSQSNLQQLQKQMNEVMQRVNKIYNDIITAVNNKRHQQVMQYQNVWNKLKHQYSTFSTELTRINQYMNEKVKDISHQNTEENLLYFHNVAMYLHKMEQIIEPPFCEYQELRIKELNGKMEDLANIVRAALNFPTVITKEEAIPSVVDKQPSQSLKKEKMTWMHKKNETSALNDKAPKKLASPRSPNLIPKNPATLRQPQNSSPKRQPYKFFHKDKSLKDRLGFQKTLKNRKSESNMFLASR